MPQKRHTAEEIIQHLRTVKIERVRGARRRTTQTKIRKAQFICGVIISILP
jgi:hypothetical protein